MTYEEIIQLFETICNDHYQVNEFSTSPDLTDLEVGNKGNQEPAVYPYVFLQPVPSRLEKGSMVYSFNMIVMDRVKRDQDKEVNTISDMIQIGQDIIAYFNLKVPRPDALIQLPTPITPFVEKFDGVVSGATFQINVQTPFNLNMCIAPYKTQAPTPPEPVEPCIDILNLGKYDETYTAQAEYGYLEYDSVANTMTARTGAAPDGINYKYYIWDDDPDRVFAAIYDKDTGEPYCVIPGCGPYNRYFFSFNFWTGAYDANDYIGGFSIPVTGGEFELTYPNC